MKINEAINKARSLLKQNNIDDANLQAKILIQYILKESQSYVIANGEKELDEYELNEYMLYINKIVNGLPIQYITNKQEFMKLNFYVDENVLIPQPDTEILVEEVIKNCNTALKITTHTKCYINETFSFDNTIYDLLSIAYFYLDDIDNAIINIDKALKMEPGNERLLKNKEIFIATKKTK